MTTCKKRGESFRFRKPDFKRDLNLTPAVLNENIGNEMESSVNFLHFSLFSFNSFICFCIVKIQCHSFSHLGEEAPHVHGFEDE